MEQIIIVEDDLAMGRGLAQALRGPERQIVSCGDLAAARAAVRRRALLRGGPVSVRLRRDGLLLRRSVRGAEQDRAEAAAAARRQPRADRAARGPGGPHLDRQGGVRGRERAVRRRQAPAGQARRRRPDRGRRPGIASDAGDRGAADGPGSAGWRWPTWGAVGAGRCSWCCPCACPWCC